MQRRQQSISFVFEMSFNWRRRNILKLQQNKQNKTKQNKRKQKRQLDIQGLSKPISLCKVQQRPKRKQAKKTHFALRNCHASSIHNSRPFGGSSLQKPTQEQIKSERKWMDCQVKSQNTHQSERRSTPASVSFAAGAATLSEKLRPTFVSVS